MKYTGHHSNRSMDGEEGVIHLSFFESVDGLHYLYHDYFEAACDLVTKPTI